MTILFLTPQNFHFISLLLKANGTDGNGWNRGRIYHNLLFYFWKRNLFGLLFCFFLLHIFFCINNDDE